MSKTNNTNAAEDSDATFFKTLDIQAGSAQLVREVLKFCLDLDVPCGIFGRAGIGKTHLVSQVAKEMNYNLITMYLHHMDKEDISGFPFPDESDPRAVLMRVKKQLVIPRDTSKKGTILFLDEWNRAERPVVNAIFTIMEKPRRAGDLVLDDDIRVVLGGNPSDAQYTVNEAEKEPAIRRRVNWIGMTCSVAAWLEYATPRFHPAVTGYIRTHKTALYDLEAHNAGRVGATPASWEKVSDAVKKAEKRTDGDFSAVETVLRPVVAGFLGLKVASDFVSDLMHHDGTSIDPDEVLNGDFKPGSESYKKVAKLIQSKAAGCSGKISQLASGIALTVATSKPAPSSAVHPVAEFVNLLEGDTQQKFLEELIKTMAEQDDPQKSYQMAFSKALSQQPAFQAARKKMAAKTSQLERQIKED